MYYRIKGELCIVHSELANEIAFTALFDLPTSHFRIEAEKVYLCCLSNARTYLLTNSYSVLGEAKKCVHILLKG